MMNQFVGMLRAAIVLDTQGLDAGVRQANMQLASMTAVVRNNWWGLANIGKAFGVVGAAASAGLGLAAKAAIDFEQQLAQVQRTMSELTDAEFAPIESGLRGLVGTLPIDPQNIADIATAAGQLGVANDQIVKFTDTVARFSAVTGIQTEQAATAIQRTIALTGENADKADEVASTILKLGQSTLSTEQEIINTVNRVSSAAALVNIPTQDVVALASATASAGIRADAAGTAFTRTFLDMRKAIRENSDDLQTWSSLAGMSAEEFSATFEENAGQALSAVVTGMGEIIASGGNLAVTLEDLGITEQRQIRLLSQLANVQGTSNVESAKLSAQLRIANDEFQEGNALQQISAKYFETTSAKIKLLRNNVFLAAQSFGSLFLPILAPAVDAVGNFAIGLGALPEPLRLLAALIAAATAAVGIAGAAFLLIIPRILLARDAWKNLTAAQAASIGTARAAGAAQAQAAAMASAGAISANLSNFGQAGAAVGFLGRAVSYLTSAKGLGTVATVAGVAGTAITLLGMRTKKAADEADDAGRHFQTFFDIIKTGGDDVKDTLKLKVLDEIDKLKHTDAVIEVGGEFKERDLKGIEVLKHGLGLDTKQALDIVFNVDPKETKRIKTILQDTIDSSRAGGSQKKAFKEFLDIINSLSSAYEKDARMARLAAEAGVELEESVDGVGSAADKTQEKIDSMASALMDLADAELAIDRGAIDIADAQQEYADAVERAGKVGQENARKLRDAEDSLASARERVVDTAEKITDAEEKVNEIKEEGNDLTSRLADAERDLAEARISSLRAQQAVKDAEWQVAFLRGEGAGIRDLQEAELDLADNRIKAAKAADDILDKEREFDDLPGDYAKELEGAERDLIGARRDHERAIEDVRRQEENLRDLRSEVASNRAYRDAQREIQRAEAGIAEAVLAQARNFADRDAALDASLGHTTTAQDKLDSFREHIRNLTDYMNGPGKQALLDYGALLMTFPDISPGVPDTKLEYGKYKGVAQTGGYTGKRAGMWLLHENELILPLDDRKRTMQLLQRFGLLSETRDSLYAAGKLPVQTLSSRTESVSYGGDQITIPVMNGPSAREISDEYTWAKTIRSRD